jgi:hypothetical protein
MFKGLTAHDKASDSQLQPSFALKGQTCSTNPLLECMYLHIGLPEDDVPHKAHETNKSSPFDPPLFRASFSRRRIRATRDPPPLPFSKRQGYFWEEMELGLRER